MENECIEIDYKKEKAKLKRLIPKTYELLKNYNCYIAGGAITSLFTGKEINDIDVYFKSKSELFKFLTEEMDREYIVYVTKKAITYKTSNSETVQFVFMNYYDEAKDIFNDFDFTINMGAFDIQKDKFVLHKDFLKDNVNRRIVFNTSTAFPLVSGTRIRKYIMKGYEIDSLELTKILLTVNNLKINSFDNLEKHLGGMYGENILQFTKEEKEKEFNLANVIDKLNRYYDEEHEFVRENAEMDSILNIEDSILRFQKLLDYQIPYFEYKGLYYMFIKENDYIRVDKEIVQDNPNLYVRDETIENSLYKTLILYKFVHKIGNKYFSYYDSDYEYKKGNEQLPNNKSLYVCRYNDLKNSNYAVEKDRALLKCEVDLDDIEELDGWQLTTKKLKVLDIVDLKDNEIYTDTLPF